MGKTVNSKKPENKKMVGDWFVVFFYLQHYNPD